MAPIVGQSYTHSTADFAKKRTFKKVKVKRSDIKPAEKVLTFLLLLFPYSVGNHLLNRRAILVYISELFKILITRNSEMAGSGS
jgi:hypothetical protein